MKTSVHYTISISFSFFFISIRDNKFSNTTGVSLNRFFVRFLIRFLFLIFLHSIHTTLLFYLKHYSVINTLQRVELNVRHVLAGNCYFLVKSQRNVLRQVPLARVNESTQLFRTFRRVFLFLFFFYNFIISFL